MDLAHVRFVGLDLAKRVFAVQLQAADGRDIGCRTLARDELAPFFASLPPSVVAMEACVGATYWCDVLRAQGHTPLPLHARAVARLRMGPKNDKKDAALILLAARLPDARAVLVKSRDQVAALSLHRMRDLVVRQETACASQLLGFLLEMGSVRWKTALALRQAADDEVSEELQGMPTEMQFTIRSCLARLRANPHGEPRHKEGSSTLARGPCEEHRIGIYPRHWIWCGNRAGSVDTGSASMENGSGLFSVPRPRSGSAFIC